jgi:hypothetical protein
VFSDSGFSNNFESFPSSFSSSENFLKINSFVPSNISYSNFFIQNDCSICQVSEAVNDELNSNYTNSKETSMTGSHMINDRELIFSKSGFILYQFKDEVIETNFLENKFTKKSRTLENKKERKFNKEGLRKNLKVLFCDFLKRYLNFLLRKVHEKDIFFKNLPKKFISDVVINRNKNWLRLSIKDLYLGSHFNFEYPHKEKNMSLIDSIEYMNNSDGYHQHLLIFLSQNLKSVMLNYFDDVFETHLKNIDKKYCKVRRDILKSMAKEFINYYDTTKGKIRRKKTNI